MKKQNLIPYAEFVRFSCWEPDLQVYPYWETVVPLLRNSCTLTEKQLYPCRETLVTRRTGNGKATDCISQTGHKNGKAYDRNGKSVN